MLELFVYAALFYFLHNQTLPLISLTAFLISIKEVTYPKSYTYTIFKLEFINFVKEFFFTQLQIETATCNSFSEK